LSLTPVQREVLWALEEAGEENTPTLVNTLRSKFSNLSDEELHREINEAVEGLSRYGFVYMSPGVDGSAGASVTLTDAGRATLTR
jgi:hypothetical protein